jgi:hypothetical protein
MLRNEERKSAARPSDRAQGTQRNWLTVRALTGPGKRDAIGARITVTGGGRTQIGEVTPGASFLATNDPRVHFGLGDASRVERLTIRWPDGRTEERRDLAANQIVTLVADTSRRPPGGRKALLGAVSQQRLSSVRLPTPTAKP